MSSVEMNTQKQDALLNEWFDSVSFDIEFGEDELPEDPDDPDSEEKGITRYVRTPAGARHYGQPIGTPIVPDSAPNAVRAFRAATSTPAIPPVVQAAATPRKARQALPVAWTDSYDGGARATRKARYNLSVRPVDGGFEWDIDHIYLQKNGGQAHYRRIESGKAKTAEAAKRAAERAAKNREETWQARGGRDYENLWDMWPGTPGLDFDPDTGEEPTPEKLEKWESDPDYRFEVAKNYAEKTLGVKVENGHMDWSPRKGMHYVRTQAEFDSPALESINTVLALHEEMYPGFLDLIESIGVTKTNAVGFNGQTMLNDGKRGSYLRFNEDIYGHISDTDAMSNMILKHSYNEETTSWHVGDRSWFDEYGEYFTETEIMQLKTVIHEIGHTVGYVALGELEGWDEYGDRMERKRQFLEDFLSTLNTWEITKKPIEYDEFVDVMRANDRHTSSGFAPFVGLDRAIATEVLSAYGSSSFHEMFAEVWCEYLFAPDPREFSIEVGTLLHNYLTEFLNDRTD